MFKGPTRGDVGAGAQFSAFTVGTLQPGADQNYGNDYYGVAGVPVGLGNTVFIYVSLSLLAPRDAPAGLHDIYYVDFWTSYNWADLTLYTARFPESRNFPRYQPFYNMDVVPTRGVSSIGAFDGDIIQQGANFLNLRWRMYRLVNPKAAEYLGYNSLQYTASPVVKEVAVADYLTVYYRFHCLDESQTPIFRTGESIQFAACSGGVGRAP